MLPKRGKSAEDSAASLKMFVFELLIHNLERVELHVQDQVDVYKSRNAWPVESSIDETGRWGNAGPKIEDKRNWIVGLFYWTALIDVFRETPPLQVSSRIRQCPVYVGILSGANLPLVDFTCL